MPLTNNKEKSLLLNGPWTLFFGPQTDHGPKNPHQLLNANWNSIPATVPGNVELDLFDAGQLADPKVGSNVYELLNLETYQWWYFREFNSPTFESNQSLALVFEGLDCLGTIWLNDTLIGHTDNMLSPHRFDITGIIRANEKNEIFIRIDSAVQAGQKYSHAPLEYALPGKWEALNIRKASHSYGWDIMPRIVSAGLWRDVKIEAVNPTRFESVYWMTNRIDFDNNSATLGLCWSIKTNKSHLKKINLNINIRRDKKTIYDNTFPIASTQEKQELHVNNIEFWWPRGYGNQPLYDATLTLIDSEKKIVAYHTSRIGIRTIELKRTDITTADQPGEFVFVVNGEKIFIKGTNWVPLDAFHSQDKKHLPDVFDMLLDLNCNMVRCWGGNVYENNDFYDLCDEHGILIWQDFALACCRSPQSDEFAAKMKAEAEVIIPKLRNHPSLALWAGNNENDVTLLWENKKHIDPNYDRISRSILKKAVHQLDPSRAYLPSSPYASAAVFKNGFSESDMPEVHLWGPRGYYKDSFYTDVRAAFVSEIGYHGCPHRDSLKEFFELDYIYPWLKNGEWNEQWLCKAVAALPTDKKLAQERNNLMTNQIKHLFGTVPKDLDLFIKASQIVQAEAKKFFIESWRLCKWDRTGILWWNLRDGWPIISDSVVDYYNRKKLAYSFIKRVQQNVCLMVDEEKNGQHSLYAVNDTLRRQQGFVTVKDVNHREVLFSGEFKIDKNSKTLVGQISHPQEQQMWLIDWTLDDDNNYKNHYLVGEPHFDLEQYIIWLGQIESSDPFNYTQI